MREDIAKRYSRALFRSATLEEVESYMPNIKGLALALKSEKFLDILSSYDVTKDRKLELVLSILDSKDKKLENFIKIIFENSRIDILPEIYKEVTFEISTQKNLFHGRLISKTEISEDVLNHLRDGFSRKIDANIILTQEISEFEGIKISVDDLGLEVGFSKERLKKDLTDHIIKAI